MKILKIELLILSFVIPSSWMSNNDEFEKKWVPRPTDESEFPYAIYIVMSNATDEICTGTLVSDEWVLTAARCMYEGLDTIVETNTSLTLYAGVIKLDNLEGKNVQKRQSKKLRFHPDDRGSIYYSLALVQVDTPFIIDRKQKIQVQPLSITSHGLGGVEDRYCKTGSFGYTNWDDVLPDRGQKKLNSRIEACNCSGVFSETFPEFATKEWSCGYPDYSGLCKGDFGAGMVCDGDLQAVSIGIVGFQEADQSKCKIKEKQSRDCVVPTTVNIYMDVCYHLKWLHTYIPSVVLNTTACEETNSEVLPSANSYIFVCIFHIVIFLLE